MFNYFFEQHLEDGEEIMAIAHRHFFIFVKNSFKTTFFGLILPVVGYFYLPEAVLLFGIWLFIGLIGMFYHFVDWYFDAWLITSHGIIDIDRDGFFDRSSTRVDYHMIDGISYSVNGLLATVFSYGDITIDKLGAKTSVCLKEAADPRKVERVVLKNQEMFVHDKSVRDHDALKNMLAEMIAYHIQSGKIKGSKK